MGSFLYNLFIYPVELLMDFVFSVSLEIIGSKGFSLIALSFVISTIMLPLHLRADALQKEEQNKEYAMKSWITHIRRTFSGDEQFMMLSAYYREQSYHPLYALRSSLSLILQVPFFFASYHYLSNLDILQSAPFHIVRNLGAPDQLLQIGDTVLNVLPIVMTACSLISAFLYAANMPLRIKFQVYGIAIVFLVILYDSPAGLVLYWTANNIYSLGKNLVFKHSSDLYRDGSLILASTGFSFLLLMYLRGKISTQSVFYFCLVVLFVCVFPLLVYCLKRRSMRFSYNHPPTYKYPLFLTSVTGLAVLSGAVIPLSLIQASPMDFILSSEQNRHPLLLVAQSTTITVGFWMIWGSIFFYLLSVHLKQVLTWCCFGYLTLAVVNHFFFYKDMGIMFDTFIPSGNVWISPKEKAYNLLLNILIIFCLLFLYRFREQKRIKAAITSGILLLTTSLTILAIQQCLSTERQLQMQAYIPYDDTADAAVDNPVHLVFSKHEKNVLILFLDRGFGGFIPFIFDERPSLVKDYDGFVFYPNTVSHGARTLTSSPAIYGGYEYTPWKINHRSSDTLREKNAEALCLLPTLFSNAGFQCLLNNPPYTGFETGIDYSIFDSIDNTQVFSMKSALGIRYPEIEMSMKESIPKQRKHNMFFFSLMRSMPDYVKRWIFDDGKYHSVAFENRKNEHVCQEYAALDMFPDITEAAEDAPGLLAIVHNKLPHDAGLLQLPDYTLTSVVDNSEYLYSWQKNFNGKINLSREEQQAQYHTNAASIILTAKWLTRLKSLGVYDNTRIILVSDHGYNFGCFDSFLVNDDVNVERFNPLLLIKDFDAKGFNVDEQFMTIADIPSIAMKDVISNPMNPFTGNPVNQMEKDQPQYIAISDTNDVRSQNPNTFKTDDAPWYTVQKNIFDPSNWHLVEKE